MADLCCDGPEDGSGKGGGGSGRRKEMAEVRSEADLADLDVPKCGRSELEQPQHRGWVGGADLIRAE